MKQIAEIKIKGVAYDSLITILGRNGYITEVFTPAMGDVNINDADHIIRVYKELKDD